MTTWVVPEQTWQFDGAAVGDVLLRQEGDDVLLATVHEAGAEWLGPVPEGALDVPSVQEPTQVPDLDAAVEPLVTVLAERGA